MRPEIGSASSLWNALLLPRDRLRLSDERQHRRQDLHLIGIAAHIAHPPLHVVVVGAAALRRRIDLEDRLRPPCREILALVRRTGLNEHRTALRGARNVQRPTHREELAAMIGGAHLLRVDVLATALIGDDRISLPAAPQLLRHPEELIGAVVPQIVLEVAVRPEVLCLGLVERRHHVPAHAATAQMIERAVRPRHLVRVKVRRRLRHGDAKPLRHRGDRRRHQRRIERRRRLGAAAQRLIDPGAEAIRCGEEIGEEHEVELAPLQRAAHAVVVRGIEVVAGAARMPPGGVGVRDLRGDLKAAEVQLTRHGRVLRVEREPSSGFYIKTVQFYEFAPERVALRARGWSDCGARQTRARLPQWVAAARMNTAWSRRSRR